MSKRSNFFRNKLLWIPFGIALLVLISQSCDSEYDFGEIKFEMSPEMDVPVAHGTYNIVDIIKTLYVDTILKTADDGSLYIGTISDSLYYRKASDLLNIPDQFELDNGGFEVGYIAYQLNKLSEDFTLRTLLQWLFEDDPIYTKEVINAWDGLTVPIPAHTNNNTNKEISLSDVDWEDLDYVQIHSGEMIVQISNYYPTEITIAAELYDALTDEVILDFGGTPISTGDSARQSYDLSGKRLSKYTRARITSIGTSGSDPVYINLDDLVNISFEFENILLEGGKGKLPKMSMQGEEAFEVQVEDGFKMSEVFANSGQLVLNLSSDLELSGAVAITLPNITRNGTVISKVVNVSPEKNSKMTINLNNCLIDLTGNAPDQFNRVKIQYAITTAETGSTVEVLHTDSVRFSLDLVNMDMLYLDGIVEKDVIPLNEGLFDFPFSFIEELASSVSFEDPQVIFTAKNSIGIPGYLDVYMKGYNNNLDSARLDAPTFYVQSPSYPGNDLLYTTMSVDTSNSNIKTFMDLPPANKLVYGSTLTLNPDEVNEPFRIYPDSYLKFGFDMRLSMDFSSSEMTSIVEMDIDSMDFSFVEFANLVTVAENRIPMDIVLDIVFYKKRNLLPDIELMRMDPIPLTPAPTDENGRAIGVSHDRILSELDSEFFEKLGSANLIKVNAHFATPDGGTKVVSLYDDDYLNLSFAVESQLKITGDNYGN